MATITLKELSVKHPYYASECNYYDSNARETYETWEDFYEEYKEADIDMNLIFRWDVFEDSGNYSMVMIFIQQRRGIYHPIIIDSLEESNADQIKQFLAVHIEKIKSIWKPLKF